MLKSAALILLCFCLQADAQYVSTNLTYTNGVGANLGTNGTQNQATNTISTATNGFVFDVYLASNFSAWLQFMGATNLATVTLGTSSNSFLQLAVSPDRVTWVTNDPNYLLQVPQNGTNVVVGWSNFTSSGVRYVRPQTLGNSATNINLTNYFITLMRKP